MGGWHRLRGHCDGGRLQALVLVRDDFWMAATRFMQALEIRLLEGENSCAVDLNNITTLGTHQYTAYYDTSGNIIIGRRDSASSTWQTYNSGITLDACGLFAGNQRRRQDQMAGRVLAPRDVHDVMEDGARR